MPIFTPKFVDLVRSVTVVQGSGPVSLGTAVSGYAGFAEAVQPGDQFYYCIQGVEKPAEREVGRGTMQPDGTIARDPVSGVPTEFTAGTKTISLVAAAEWFERQEQSASGAGATSAAPDREVLAAMPADRPAMLGEQGREGIFRFDPSDLSARVAYDPMQGVYVPPASDPSGASGAWVRSGSVLTPHMLGAVESVKNGNPMTGNPSYFESQVDATAEIQALFDLVKAETRKTWTADLSGFWSVRDDDGDGYCVVIDQPFWLVRTFRMGHFSVLSEEVGEAVFKIANASFNHRVEGRWEIWGGPGGDADKYVNRGFRYAIDARALSLWDIESLYCRGFRKWALFMPNLPVEPTYNQNIGAKIGRLKASDCGSVPGNSLFGLSSAYSGGIRTGAANNGNQRSVITLTIAGQAAHYSVDDDDWVVIDGEPYQVMAVDVAANKLSIFPWLPDGKEVSGMAHGLFGGAVHVGGSDTARVKIEFLDTIACGIGAYSRGLYGMTVHESLVQSGGAAMILGVDGGNTIGNAVLAAHWEGTQFDLIARNSDGSNTFICAAAMGGDDGANPFKKCRAIAPNDGTSLNQASALPSVTFNIGGVDYHSASGSTKSRAHAPTISNDPRWSRIRKVADSVTATLKYIEPVDRFFRDHFAAELEVVGTSGGAPTGTIQVSLDADDQAAGIKLNGSTQPFVLNGASGPVRLEFWLDTNGAAKDWKAIVREGGPPARDGREIVNASKTRVVGASGGGYRITRNIGGGPYDASAMSTDPVTGDFILRVKWVSGASVAGISLSPGGSSGFGDIIGLYQDGGTIQAMSYGGGVGSGVAQKAHGFLRYTQSTDSFRFYAGDSPDIVGATEIPGSAIVGAGLGATWFFDSSLSTAGACIEALFDLSQDSTPAIANAVYTEGQVLAVEGIGIGIGGGGTVTQTLSKSAGVTLDKLCGQIMMSGAALAANASASFTLTNSKITATDAVIVNIGTGASADAYAVCVTGVAAGSCRIQVRNQSGSELAEPLVLNFALIRAVAA